MDNSNAISTLNSLIETCRDGEQGFRTAAEHLKDSQAKSLFLRYAEQRGQMVRELQQEVRSLGGEAEQGGSVSGSAHRGWMNLKAAVTGGSDSAIVAEAERGEDVAKAAFEKALSAGLPPTTLAVVRQQAARVREAHDAVRAMEKSGARG